MKKEHTIIYMVQNFKYSKASRTFLDAFLCTISTSKNIPCKKV